VLLRFGSPRVLARRAVFGSVAASVAVVGLPAMAQAAPPTAPFISELHYDNVSTDVDEFVEVQLPAGTSSSGLSLVLYNGNGGASYATLALPEVTAPAGEAAVVFVAGPSAGIQNGNAAGTEPDGLALVRGTAVLEFLSYEGSFTAANGAAAGMTSTNIGVSESGAGPIGESLSRRVNTATQNLEWFASAPATKGAINPVHTPAVEEPTDPEAPCDVVPTHEIGAVQGDGATTPLEGEQVTVRGMVVGDLQAGFRGFYLQDVDGDADLATSDGIFVFSQVPVDLGDTVAVSGEATEFNAQTQIVSSEDVEVCTDGTAADLPAAAALDLPATDAERERLESMLVAPVDTLTVSEVFDLTRFGELTLSEGGLLVQPTELASPGSAAAQALAADNTLRRIVLDDGRSAGVSVTTRPYLSSTTPVRVGDELAFSSPLVLGWGFD
jgi:uncharacterized protein